MEALKYLICSRLLLYFPGTLWTTFTKKVIINFCLISEFGGQGNAHQAFNARQPPKKKRKSRTAFTNHQIFELEKRFLYQKYLSPADRDDIAHQLGLTNAQVGWTTLYLLLNYFQSKRTQL